MANSRRTSHLKDPLSSESVMSLQHTTYPEISSTGSPSVSNAAASASLPWGSMMGSTGEAGLSGQADDGEGRGDPCVFVLECESMLVRQATCQTVQNDTASKTQTITHSRNQVCVFL